MKILKIKEVEKIPNVSYLQVGDLGFESGHSEAQISEINF